MGGAWTPPPGFAPQDQQAAEDAVVEALAAERARYSAHYISTAHRDSVMTVLSQYIGSAQYGLWMQVTDRDDFDAREALQKRVAKRAEELRDQACDMAALAHEDPYWYLSDEGRMG